MRSASKDGTITVLPPVSSDSEMAAGAEGQNNDAKPTDATRHTRVDFKTIATNQWLRLGEVDYIREKSQTFEVVDASRGPVSPIRSQRKKWELVQRTTQRSSESDYRSSIRTPDAVDVIAIVRNLKLPGVMREDDENSQLSTFAEKYLVLVSQYRPPTDSIALEFPAGLVDKGEEKNVIETAIRELKEETGFVSDGSAASSSSSSLPGVVSPLLCYEPGLTDSLFHMVKLEVDGAAPENQNPVPSFDEDEDIEVHLVPLGDTGINDKNGTGKESLLQRVKALAVNVGERHQPDKGPAIIDGKVYTFAIGLQFSGL